MQCPFPGMDPYLEHPSLWPDVHNRLVAALADELAEKVAPRYYVGLELRTYQLDLDELLFIGRPDVSVLTPGPVRSRGTPPAPAGVKMLEVSVPTLDEVSESFLVVRDTQSGHQITVLELLSPANKLHSRGRVQYEQKRASILASRTSLVEIDLLRAGDPMRIVGPVVASRYRILISPGYQRPRSYLFPFELPDPIPEFTLPLLAGDEEPRVPLNRVLHDLYRRGRFDLRLDYSSPPLPPLTDAEASWAQGVVRG